MDPKLATAQVSPSVDESTSSCSTTGTAFPLASTSASTSHSMEMEVNYPLPKSKNDPDYDFEVESLQSSLTDDSGVVRFEVKWKGYDKDDNTFEPVDQLKGCHKLLKTTLLASKSSKKFQVNTNFPKVENFNEAYNQAMLKGWENVPGWQEYWPKVEKSKKVKVIGQSKEDGEGVEYVVLFDNHNMAFVSEKDLTDNYGSMATSAIIEYHTSIAFKY